MAATNAEVQKFSSHFDLVVSVKTCRGNFGEPRSFGAAFPLLDFAVAAVDFNPPITKRNMGKLRL